MSLPVISPIIKSRTAISPALPKYVEPFAPSTAKPAIPVLTQIQPLLPLPTISEVLDARGGASFIAPPTKSEQMIPVTQEDFAPIKNDDTKNPVGYIESYNRPSGGGGAAQIAKAPETVSGESAAVPSTDPTETGTNNSSGTSLFLLAAITVFGFMAFKHVR